MTPTVVYDTYWRFAAERLAMFYRRQTGEREPWTTDPILQAYRFTNTFRAADRVSQYLIGEVQYRPGRPREPREIFFRTLLFKIFNRIDTWEALERDVGPLELERIDLGAIDVALHRMLARGKKIYSAAYIMPSPALGHTRKHSNHLALLAQMLEDRLPNRLCQVPSLQTAYELILGYPGLGPFLAFQYAIDLNYSELLDFAEADFVVAGPGALDGIAKCFADVGGRTAEQVIHWVCERQETEFRDRGIAFEGLFGRHLQPIDCQNLFCEISKYARVAHPEIEGKSGRRRIKQSYRRDGRSLPSLAFPPRWNLQPTPTMPIRRVQPELAF